MKKELKESVDVKADRNIAEGDKAVASKKKEALSKSESVSVEKKVSAGCAFLRMVLFAGVFIVLFFFANKFFVPEVSRQNSYVKRRTFYDEPKNTIETAVLGASIAFHSAIPMQMYEEYGICAYDFGSSGQPVLASYYWLCEAYRLHGESLKNVCMDVSILRKNEKFEWYEAAIDPMKLSPLKVKAVYEYNDDVNDTITHLFPLFAYHSRWNALTALDFDRSGYAAEDYMRGYFFNTSTAYFEGKEYDEMEIPNFYPDYGEETVPFKTESLYYMQKIIDFCKEKDLNLIIYKTPGQGVGIPAHNTIQELADKNGIPFFDFNFEPYLSEVGYVRPTDNVDTGHLNFYGASKFTAWLGKYLSEECGATDVRGKDGYEHLDRQLEDYHARVLDVMYLRDAEDPVEYIRKTLTNTGFSAFISVKGDAATRLSAAQRKELEGLGLTKLAGLKPYDSYAAVIDDGRVVAEEIMENATKKKEMNLEDEEPEDETDYNLVAEWAYDPDVSTIDQAESLTFDDVRSAREIRFADPEDYIELEGKLSDGTVYRVVSGITNEYDRASIQLEGEQKCVNDIGMNVVVYDKVLSGVVDRAVFNTGETSLRTGYDYENNLAEALEAGVPFSKLSEELQKLYLYYRRSDAKRLIRLLRKEIGNNDLVKYLSEVKDQDGYAVFVIAKGRVADGIGEKARAALKELGFDELSKLADKESYISIVQDGEIITEQRTGNFGLVEQAGSIRTSEGIDEIIMYDISSGRTNNTAAGSIALNGAEYAGETRGIYILVWDTVTDMKVDVIKFDPKKTPIKED